MFGTKQDPLAQEILDQITNLKREVTALKGERKATTDLKKLDEEYSKAKKELVDLQIELDRVKEQHEREKREIEHKVGLQRKTQTFEIDAAKREAKVTIREENLTAQEERFKEHVEFIESRFDQQFKALNKITEKILDRMPETKQLITVGSNGDAKRAVATKD